MNVEVYVLIYVNSFIQDEDMSQYLRMWHFFLGFLVLLTLNCIVRILFTYLFMFTFCFKEQHSLEKDINTDFKLGLKK